MSDAGAFACTAWAVALVAVVAIAGGFLSCDRRDHERYQLRRLAVEKCRMTPAQAEREYPDDETPLEWPTFPPAVTP